MAKYSIGLDYGTLSARAILVDIETGETIAQSIYPYPHAVMESHIPDGTQLPAGWALQDPQDYLEAMVDTIQNVVVKSKVLPEEVVGIGVDFTSATILPVYEDGTALCMTEKFRRSLTLSSSCGSTTARRKKRSSSTRSPASAERSGFLVLTGEATMKTVEESDVEPTCIYESLDEMRKYL